LNILFIGNWKLIDNQSIILNFFTVMFSSELVDQT